MVNVTNKEHFKKALKFAKESSKETRKSFLHCLRTLNRIKRNYNGKLHIFPDFVENSFAWAIEKNEKSVYHGGMILHGYQQTFSVELTPTNYPHWSIHT